MKLQVEHFAENMMAGLSDECWSTMMRFVHAGRNSLFIYEQLLAPSMRYIGSLWEQNVVTVADEHLASGVCDYLITRYAHSKKAKQPIGGKAMFLCVEGESHFFGLKMVSSLFQEYGWESKFFGPSLPLEYALISALKWQPDVIALSASMSYHLPTLRRYAETLEKMQHQPLIMVGSRLSETYAAHFRMTGRVVVCDNLLEVVQWLDRYERKGTTNTMLG